MLLVNSNYNSIPLKMPNDSGNKHAPVSFNAEQASYNRLKTAFERGATDVRHHTLGTFLMGVGTLSLSALPVFKMPFKMALKMAPVHMGIMVLINFGIGFFNSLKNSAK